MSCIKLDYNITQQQWKRPIYENENDLMVPSVKADFEDDIVNEFIAECYRSNKQDRFPRTEDNGVVILVKSKKECLLPMVVKNVLDALSDKAYKDDIQVTSLLAKLEVCGSNVVRVGSYPDDRVKYITVDDALFNKSFIDFTVETRPVDKVLSIPKNPKHKMHSNAENQAYQKLIREEIGKQYSGGPLLGDVSIQIEINSTSTDADIDNIGLNYIIAGVGMIIKDIRQIKVLYMNLYRGTQDKTRLTIETI